MKLLKSLLSNLMNHKYLLSIFVIILESMFCFIIINKVKYTEIDWKAYMQEVEYFINGERNYMVMKGDTGPLVYPAGFVYVFSALYFITEKGINILFGQYIFAFIYVLIIFMSHVLYQCGFYHKIKDKNYKNTIDYSFIIILLLSLSKRIHSIFVLRMFNDCIALAFGMIAILCYTKRHYRLGSFLYSISVSIKMNMLLYAPGILLVLWFGNGIIETAICLLICANTQVVLGWPFLNAYPQEYVMRAFDFGRVFMYKWTVNFKFLSPEMFVSKKLSITLLIGTIIGIILFAKKYIKSNEMQLKEYRFQFFDLNCGGIQNISNHFIIMSIFTSNFIGVAFARSLHYQFYCWYFFTLPYLLWNIGDSHGSIILECLFNVVRLMVLASIEWSFNVYPATASSSMTLQTAHIIILIGLYFAPTPAITIKSNFKTTSNAEKSKNE